MKVRNISREKIVIVIECIIIVCLSLVSFDKIGFPSVINDEFGYLGNAAYFAGYGWESVLSDVPYYSYGYSIFLTPLYWLFDSGITVYYGASIINSFSLVGAFLSLNYILKELFPDIEVVLRSSICFMATVNMYTFIMVGYALAECFLFFSMCLIIASFLVFLKNPSLLNSVILGGLISFIHLLHQRALAVVVASIMLIMFMTFVKKISKKSAFIVVITIVLGLILQTEIKELVKEAIWSGNTVTTNGNDYTGVVGVIFELTSIDGILNFIFSFISKLFAIIVSYFFVPLLFMEICLKKIYMIFIKRVCNLGNKEITYIFLLLILICAAGISALFALYPIRKDSVIYTRYIEYMIGPVIAIALAEMTKLRVKKIRISVYGIMLLLCCPFVKKALSWVSNQQFIKISTPVLGAFYSENELYLYSMVMISILLFLLCSYILYNKKIFYNKIFIYIFVSAQIFIGYNIKEQWTDFNNIKAETYDIGIEIQKKIEKDNKNYEVLLMRENEEYYTMHYYGGFIQQYLPKQEMKYVTIDSIERDIKGENKLIVADNSCHLNESVLNCKKIYTNERLSLYEYKGEKDNGEW